MRQHLNLSILLVFASLDRRFLSLLELRSGQEFSLAVAANFIKLTYELGILQVKKVLIAALVIQILLIVIVTVEIGVEEVVFVIFSHS